MSDEEQASDEGGAEAGDVTLETPFGNVSFELYWQHAPNTCKNFFELAKRGTG